ncbi:MAG: dihydroorotase [Bacteroidales bacterium]|jgi:dihydroorotase|nr:dihydroorotase [Bacteroidales bacterium]
MNKYVIKNAAVVNENRTFIATVFILDEKIEKIVEGDAHNTSGYQVIDAEGKYLLPGVIDTHVHFREPGLTHKGDMASESRAAVAGGVTSIVDMPNTIPQTAFIQHFNEKCAIAAQNCLTNYSFYVGATNNNLKELLTLDPAQIFGIKVFMGSSTGNMLVDKRDILEEIFKNSSLPIVTHCEDEAIIKRNSEQIKKEYGENPSFSVHPLIRSSEACYVSSHKAVELAEKYGTKLHIAHLSTEKELSLLQKDIPLANKKITAEACVHYLWFSDQDYNRLGAFIKCNPAVKSDKNRQALRNAVNDEIIDMIVTDHAPHTLEEKQKSYFSAPGGIPLIQHSLTAMLELANRKIFTLEKIVRQMCHNPAVIFNIEKRGFIREGYFADLTLLELSRPWNVNNDNILYKCKWSPFSGETFNSKILYTFVNGNLVLENGKINDKIGSKQLTFVR